MLAEGTSELGFPFAERDRSRAPLWEIVSKPSDRPDAAVSLVSPEYLMSAERARTRILTVIHPFPYASE